MKMLIKYWTDEKATKISGKPGWEKFTGAKLKGEYLLKVVVASSAPEDRNLLKQEMAYMADWIAKFKPLIPELNLKPIAKKFLELYKVPINEVFPPEGEILPEQQGVIGGSIMPTQEIMDAISAQGQLQEGGA